MTCRPVRFGHNEPIAVTSHRPKQTESLAFVRVCAVLGLLAVFLQGSGPGHLWLVEHAQCPEHGDLMHGEAHAGSTPSSLLSNTPSFESHGGAPSNADHEHCPVAAERRWAVAPISGAQLAEALEVAEDSRWGPPAIVARTGIARFRVAPKNSPPV